MSSILKYNDQILKHNDQILSVSSSTPTPCPSCGWIYPSDWHCYVRYCNLDDTALNALFASLPTVTAKTIYIKGNPGIGVGGYDATIATSKGWTVNTTT